MTEAQANKVDKLKIARRELFIAKLREVETLADQARNKPTGGMRGRYLTTLRLLDNKDTGFMVLPQNLFGSTPTSSVQSRFNQVAKDHNLTPVTVWEHPKGEKVLINFQHPSGEYNFERWLLTKDHGFTTEELNEFANEFIKNSDEVEQSEQIDEFIDEVLAESDTTTQ